MNKFNRFKIFSLYNEKYNKQSLRLDKGQGTIISNYVTCFFKFSVKLLQRHFEWVQRISVFSFDTHQYSMKLKVTIPEKC